MSRGTIGAGLALALLAAHPAFSQQDDPANRYEMLYGTPVDVSLSDLVQNPMAYSNRAVRTTGRLEMSPTIQQRRTYILTDSAVDSALLQPVPEIGAEFESDAMRFLGRQTQITGLVQELSGNLGNPNQPRIAITFWQFMGPPEEVKGPLKFVDVSLESLVSRPGREDGKTVRVVGKFRGRNLYGDLPSRSERASGDWVIKDDLYAVWVSGRKPKGSGWELDANLKRDTGKWIEVIGKPETRNGVTYVRAAQVRITDPPRPKADAAPPPPPPERPKVPPVVVFALPLDGEGDVASDSRFVVQFNKDMDEATFKGHVMLRYSGPTLPGDREFDGLKLTYDQGHRALTIDPGDVLRPGRQIELMLLPGIADIDGLTLVPRPGKQVDGAVDVLRFRTGT
ncbi:MAG TPA: Ig-like domain-containing protein [Vicinamibacteria bacterium]